MPESQMEVLIEQLKRSNRRWKRLALGALASLLIAFGLTAFAVQQASRMRSLTEEAEQARWKAEEDLKAAKQRAEQMLYAMHIQQAARAWKEGAPERKKP